MTAFGCLLMEIVRVCVRTPTVVIATADLATIRAGSPGPLEVVKAAVHVVVGADREPTL